MGQVWAISMMRDEADVCADVVTHLAEEGVDGIIVADNRSTDGTADILRDLDVACPVIVIDDPEPGYYQSLKMTALAAQAADRGARWIIPFDADELWLGGDEHLVNVLRGQRNEVGVVTATLYNHFRTALDLDDECVFRSATYRQRHPGALPKVAYRWHADTVIAAGNHGVIDPCGVTVDVGVTIRHFPYRSFEHFARKAANGREAYLATDLPDNLGAHWRQHGEILERHGEDALREVWERWYWFLSPTDADLVHDPAPFRRWTS